jgi:protein transport protein SEC61 subunit gamma and related proteins
MSDQMQEILDLPKDFVKEGTLFINRCTKRSSPHRLPLSHRTLVPPAPFLQSLSPRCKDSSTNCAFCSLADTKEFVKICQAVGVGFLIMGYVPRLEDLCASRRSSCGQQSGVLARPTSQLSGCVQLLHYNCTLRCRSARPEMGADLSVPFQQQKESKSAHVAKGEGMEANPLQSTMFANTISLLQCRRIHRQADPHPRQQHPRRWSVSFLRGWLGRREEYHG